MPVKALNEWIAVAGVQGRQDTFDLRRTVEDLDPSQAAGAKKFLGMILFGDRITDYFRSTSRRSRTSTASCTPSSRGRTSLQKDNVALNLEKKALESMGWLNQYVYVAERLDARAGCAGRDPRHD